MILLRDQELSEEDEVRFAEKFGPPAKIHTPQFVRGHPAVMLISNIREDGKPIGALPDGEMHFHTDQCHQERPAMASMLYAIEVPSEGGNTLFANGYKAYETLPAEIKRRIDGRKRAQRLRLRQRRDQARHAGRRRRAVLRASGGAHPSGDRPQGALRQPPDDRAHRRIAAGGERRAAGLSVRPPGAREFVYEHVWRPGDLLMWDNRCALHARTDFSAGERRLMRRVTILGEKPV